MMPSSSRTMRRPVLLGSLLGFAVLGLFVSWASIFSASFDPNQNLKDAAAAAHKCARRWRQRAARSSERTHPTNLQIIQSLPVSFWSEEYATSANTTVPKIIAAWHWHDDARLLLRSDDNDKQDDENENDEPPNHIISQTSGTIRIPNIPPYTKYSLQSVLDKVEAAAASASQANAHQSLPDPPSVVFYGSSHLREIYLALVRLERGLKFDAPLEDVVIRVPSGNRREHQAPSCDPQATGFSDGKYGVDLEACGPPGKRLVPELSNSSVAIGFKTFLHTPDAEDLFVDFLTANHLRHPTVLVVDIGIWGPRGQRRGTNSPRTNSTMTVAQEVDYFLDWIQTTFSESKIVYVYEKPPSFQHLEPIILHRLSHVIQQQQLAKRKSDQTGFGSIPDSVLIRKDLIIAKRPDSVPCVHGCGGPVTMMVATLLMDYMAAWLAPSLDDDDGDLCED